MSAGADECKRNTKHCGKDCKGKMSTISVAAYWTKIVR